MDTKVIEQRKNVAFTIGMGPPTVFPLSFDVKIQFIPDAVVVKSVSYKLDETEPGAALFTTNMIDDEVLFSFLDYCCYSPNTEFILKKPISGSIQFNYKDPAVARAGILCFILDFVKYKDEKQTKIY